MVPVTLPLTSYASIQKGSYVYVRINSEALRSRMEMCKFSLIGRLTLSKGDKPNATLKEKLNVIWKLPTSWHLISLGCGYYHILISSHEESSRIWSMGSLNLKSGVWRLQPWDKNFNPYSQKNISAQVWMCFWDLPWVYWHP